jgi:hypothetical protein
MMKLTQHGYFITHIFPRATATTLSSVRKTLQEQPDKRWLFILNPNCVFIMFLLKQTDKNSKHKKEG